ncbi:IclR family transcriptional regulator [Streptomyces oceani]|uniref:IclR family transcriptional regulator n=1 Tax=Streptomyces oceani TaxID=1075402 RepID=A0A1E7KJU3_9ACTN|nr:IclR family transcriptional regulator [Streptomyces oceani]OEV04124.1 IclR family transcriptional regulator [Streptomyces oceani]
MAEFATDRATPPGSLQTVDRALLVLLSFERSRPDWGVTEVAEEFGWDTSVAQRLLATLAGRGFLVSDPVTRRYRIGPAALRLGRLWERSGSLELLAKPVLEELSRTTGDTVLFSLPDSFHMRCVVAAEGPAGPLRYHPLVGELYPAHAGATSKSYYAFLPDEQRHRLFRGRPMARFTDRTVTDADLLEEELLRIRAQGYAWTVGEYDTGIGTVAVPVFLGPEPYGSLSLGGAEERFPHGPGDRLDPLRQAAELLEKRLTQPPQRPRPPRARTRTAPPGKTA